MCADRVLVGTISGGIRSMRFPLGGETDEFQEHQCHIGPVTKLRISYDDQYLFSVSEDGCLYVYKISEKEESGLKKERILAFSDEVGVFVDLASNDQVDFGVFWLLDLGHKV
jgi:hypothetical protein